MKKVYIVWQDFTGGFHNDTCNVDKPLNHNTIIEAICDRLGYYGKHDFARVISWQEEIYE